MSTTRIEIDPGRTLALSEEIARVIRSYLQQRIEAVGVDNATNFEILNALAANVGAVLISCPDDSRQCVCDWFDGCVDENMEDD